VRQSASSIRVGRRCYQIVVITAVNGRLAKTRGLHDEICRVNGCHFGIEADYQRRPKLRVLGVALAGVLTLSATVTAHSASLGSNLGQAMTVGNGNGSNWHPAPGVGGGSWHPAHSGPSLPNRGWGPYVGPGVPTYWVWGGGAAVKWDKRRQQRCALMQAKQRVSAPRPSQLSVSTASCPTLSALAVAQDAQRDDPGLATTRNSENVG
jgi:hypothetical protein